MALFFNQRKPRGFDYKPRYYDPEKEAREERKKIVLGERYKAPGTTEAGAGATGTSEVDEAGGVSGDAAYVPGALLREHIAARRGNANAAKQMRGRRRKQRSTAVLIGMLVLIVLIVWMLYFK